MKKYLLLLVLLPLLAFGQEPTKKQEDGLDKKIDKVFGQATGWFVNGIFYQIPFGSVEDELTINLNPKGSTGANQGDVTAFKVKNGTKYEVKKDTLYVSNIPLSGSQIAENLEKISDNVPAILEGGTIKVATADIRQGSSITVKAMAPFTKVFWVLFPLILGALFFTFYFKFINFRGFFTSINIVRGKYDDIDHQSAVDNELAMDGDIPDTIRDESKEGEVTHFQALTAALSATVGLGNIAGVAIAVSIGGAGATFWMIIAGFLGMASKFVECTLGVKYRDIAADGTVYGGPMYYLTKGLKAKGLAGLGKILAVLFAIFVIGGSFGGGNMFQVNQAFQLVENITGGN